MTPEAISTYQQHRIDSRLRYELGDDSLRISGVRLRKPIDRTVPLTDLDPQYERVWVYGFVFKAGCSFLGAGLLLLLFLGSLLFLVGYRGFFAIPLGLAAALIAAGGALILFNLDKIECVVFRGLSGSSPMIVVRDAADSGGFDQFIARVVVMIRKARGKAY